LTVLQAAAAKQVGSELSGLTKSKIIRQKLETAKNGPTSEVQSTWSPTHSEIA
jgi:hypothetical protein